MGILGTGLQDGLLLKPIRYQWAMDLYDQAVANTWFPNEIQLGEDIADFKKMTDEERHAVTFLMSYFNPNELLVNKALAFGVYPYVNAAEATLYLAKQMWEEANHCMSFEYVLETFPIDREAAYGSHVNVPSMARKEEFEVKYIRRMTEQTLDITTTEGKKDFVRNLVAYNVILEGVDAAKKIGELSQGQRQKLAIIRAIVAGELDVDSAIGALLARPLPVSE